MADPIQIKRIRDRHQARYYLEPMGIESWQPRVTLPSSGKLAIDLSHESTARQTSVADSQPAEAANAVTSRAGVAVPSADNLPSQCHSAAPEKLLKPQQWHSLTAASLTQFITAQFTVLAGKNPTAPLALVLEEPQVDVAGNDLLASMLAAIRLTLVQQNQLTIAIGGSSQAALAAIAGNQLLLLMSRLPVSSQLSGLDHLRGRIYQLPTVDTAFAVTIHPLDCISNPAAKRPAWEDLKRVKAYLDERRN